MLPPACPNPPEVALRVSTFCAVTRGTNFANPLHLVRGSHVLGTWGGDQLRTTSQLPRVIVDERQFIHDNPKVTDSVLLWGPTGQLGRELNAGDFSLP